MSTPLRAGVACMPLPVAPGLAMMGYGARSEPARGEADPLSARALYLEDGSERLLLVACDLCLLAPAQCEALRVRIARDCALPAAAVCVACIHTHSGPETGFAELAAGRPAPPHVAALLGAIVEAARRAHAAAAPARLGSALARARIGRNRRVANGPVDERVGVLRIDTDDGAPRAVLFVHGCHPTALGHDNLRWSADWPGEARRVVEARLPGATALFALGAHADVDPRTRGLQDIAVAGQSVGVGYAEMAALGRELGEAVADAAEKVETRAEARADAYEATQGDVPAEVQGDDRGALRVAARQAVVEVHTPAGPECAHHRAGALAALGLPPDAHVPAGELYARAEAAFAGLPPAERRERMGRVRLHLRDRQALRVAGGASARVPVQLLQLGDLQLLGLPFETTVDVGLEWAARSGAPLAFPLSIANGWLRYLPHRMHFEAPTAHHMYEVLNATFRPDTAERLLAAGEVLRADTGGDTDMGQPGGNG